MDSHAALAVLRANEKELRRRGVRHAALFGSMARGEADASSDLDLMIDLDGEAVRDVYAYVGLCRFIGTLFPVPVDVANRATLKGRIRIKAERDALTAF